jgi:hypothetical protein
MSFPCANMGMKKSPYFTAKTCFDPHPHEIIPEFRKSFSLGNLMIKFHLTMLLNIYPIEYLHQMLVNPWRFPMEFTTSPVLAPVQLLSHHWSCKHQIDPGWSRYKRSFVGISRDKNYLQYLLLSAPRYMSMEYSRGNVRSEVFFSRRNLRKGTESTGWAPVKERPRVKRLEMSSRQWLVCPGNLGVGHLVFCATFLQCLTEFWP